VECLFRGLRNIAGCYPRAAHSHEVDLTLGVTADKPAASDVPLNTTRLRSSSLVFASSRLDPFRFQLVFAVFRGLVSGAIRKDHMVTTESWSLLQSACTVRNVLAASRGFILPLMRFIRYAPSPHKTNRVHSRCASASSVVGYQTDESRSAHVVFHHRDGLLHVQPPDVLQPVTAMGFGTFQCYFPHLQAEASRWEESRTFPCQGSHPSKNPTCQ
jgi:hypothetical protein